MINTAQSLAEWFQQFDLPVYLESDVPDGAEAPYIIIPLKDPDWRSKVSFPVSVWYRTTTNLPMIQKADAIVGAVGEGVRIQFTGGLLVLRTDNDTPVQIMVEGDYRLVRIPLTLNAYHLPGE